MTLIVSLCRNRCAPAWRCAGEAARDFQREVNITNKARPSQRRDGDRRQRGGRPITRHAPGSPLLRRTESNGRRSATQQRSAATANGSSPRPLSWAARGAGSNRAGRAARPAAFCRTPAGTPELFRARPYRGSPPVSYPLP